MTRSSARSKSSPRTRDRRLVTAELSARRIDDELVCVTPDATIATEHFPDDSLSRCTGALRGLGTPAVGRD